MADLGTAAQSVAKCREMHQNDPSLVENTMKIWKLCKNEKEFHRQAYQFALIKTLGDFDLAKAFADNLTTVAKEYAAQKAA